MIKNIQGRDMIGINHYDRGRNGNKISLMKISTSNVHDVNLIEPTLDDITIKI